MIISKYPIVVQKEILDNMNYVDLFLLSFVSKNMNKLIKWSQKKRFESIRPVDYHCHDISDLPFVHIPFKGGYEGIIDLENKYRNKNPIFQLNVSGKTIDFQWHDKNKVAMAYFDIRDKESVIESVHNYFLDFFGPTMKYHWRVDDVEEDFNLFIPKLQNTSLCTKIYLNEDFKDMENLEALFSSSPVFKSVKLKAALTTELFNPESKFYQAESLCVKQSDHTFPNILRHFKGRQAMIYCGQWETSQDLIELVNKWKSGEAFQNLEFLKLKLGAGEVFEKQILNEIGAKYIDQSKQPPAHTLPKV
ncbi:hypothetical protein B9Z55_000822 [Caenorhabditis nigoni]|uniref:F-box domain-containing protein n=1 Tax=Caenorhabditis nigoni TaxID=1611254 RepID=A0A2G5VV27_9PELO|nr:hypothetical protein B9Z55_000822 [Caenorhabditis nigoni]